MFDYEHFNKIDKKLVKTLNYYIWLKKEGQRKISSF